MQRQIQLLHTLIDKSTSHTPLYTPIHLYTLYLQNHRVSFKCNNETVRLDNDSKMISEYIGDVKSPVELSFKDLGPQIGYRTVFLIEYFGPMLFVGLYACKPQFLYGEAASNPFSWVALLGIACWMIHFLKREFETIFVHKFSRPTMPLNNLFKNSMYYWSFGGMYTLYTPYTPYTHYTHQTH